MLCARPARIALRKRGLALGSPPPVFAASVISLDNLLKILPRFSSIAPLKRLTFDHLLCPAIGCGVILNLKTCEQCSPRERMTCEERNLPRQLIARKLTSSIAAQAFVAVSRVGERQPARKLTNTRTNGHINMDRLICQYCELKLDLWKVL